MPPFDSLPDHEAAGVREDNVLVKLWLHPRATLQFILTHCPDKYVPALLVLGGIVRSLDRAQRTNMGDKMSLPGVLLMAILVGGAFGWLTYYAYAWGLSLTGQWLGGQATTDRFKTVVAWALVPTVLTLIPFALELDMHGENTFRSEVLEVVNLPLSDSFLEMAMLFSNLALTVWSVVIFVIGTRLIQGFGVGRALANMLLPGALLLVGIMGAVGLVKGLGYFSH